MFVEVYMPERVILEESRVRVIGIEEHTRYKKISPFQAVDRYKWLTSPYHKWFETQYWTWAERTRSYRRR
jgi:hypothetical protein